MAHVYTGFTVRQLIELLEQAPPDTPIVMSSDPEGNRLATLCEVYLDEKCFVFTEFGIGELVITDLNGEHGFTEDDLYKGDDAVTVISLWPSS